MTSKGYDPNLLFFFVRNENILGLLLVFFAFMVKRVQGILSDQVSGVKATESDSIIKNLFTPKGLNKQRGRKVLEVYCRLLANIRIVLILDFMIGKHFIFRQSIVLCRRHRKAIDHEYAKAPMKGLADNAMICLKKTFKIRRSIILWFIVTYYIVNVNFLLL